MDRIRLAREFDIPSWEEPAYLTLCERDEPLTMSESEVLGLKAVLHVGIVRERELRRRLKEAEAKTEKVAGKESGRQGVAEEPAKVTTCEGSLARTASVPGLNEKSKPAPEPEPASRNSKCHVPNFISCALTAFDCRMSQKARRCRNHAL